MFNQILNTIQQTNEQKNYEDIKVYNNNKNSNNKNQQINLDGHKSDDQFDKKNSNSKINKVQFNKALEKQQSFKKKNYTFSRSNNNSVFDDGNNNNNNSNNNNQIDNQNKQNNNNDNGNSPLKFNKQNSQNQNIDNSNVHSNQNNQDSNLSLNWLTKSNLSLSYLNFQSPTKKPGSTIQEDNKYLTNQFNEQMIMSEEKMQDISAIQNSVYAENLQDILNEQPVVNPLLTTRKIISENIEVNRDTFQCQKQEFTTNDLPIFRNSALSIQFSPIKSRSPSQILNINQIQSPKKKKGNSISQEQEDVKIERIKCFWEYRLSNVIRDLKNIDEKIYNSFNQLNQANISQDDLNYDDIVSSQNLQVDPNISIRSRQASQYQQVNDQDYMDLFTHNFKLQKLVQEFKQHASAVSKLIILDKIFPKNLRKYKKLRSNHYLNKFQIQGEELYLVDKVLYRLGYIQVRDKNNPKNEKLNLYDDTILKCQGNEFRNTNHVNDILINLQQEKINNNIKVPLTCKTNYLGYRIIAMALMPISKDTQVWGVMPEDNSFKNSSIIRQQLIKIGEILNLKQYQSKHNKQNRIAISLSYDSLIHAALQKPWEEVEIEYNLSKQQKLPKKQSSDDCYALIEGNIKKENPNEIKMFKNRNRTNTSVVENKPSYNLAPPFYYLTNLAHLMPVCLDIYSEKDENILTNKLRPEFVKNFKFENEDTCSPLSSGCFINKNYQGDSVNDEKILSMAVQQLLKQNLQQFIEKLDKLDILPSDSKKISQIMHLNGINMRYLGKLTKLSSIPHTQIFLKIEMVARVCKKIFRSHTADFIQSGQAQKFIQEESDFEEELDNIQDEEVKEELYDNIINEISSLGEQFLDVLFGKTQDSINMWNKIIRTQVIENFDYDIGQYPHNLPLGQLLEAIQYHLCIKFEDKLQNQDFSQNKIVDFDTPNFFSKNKCIELIYSKSQTFSYSLNSLNQIMDNQRNFYLQNKIKLNQISLIIKLKILELQNPVLNQFRRYFLTEKCQIFTQLAKQYLEIGNFVNAEKYAKLAIFIFDNRPCETFLALQILQQCLFNKTNLSNQDQVENDSKFFLDICLQCQKSIIFYWGQNSPFILSLYGIISKYYIHKLQFDQALQYLEKSINICDASLSLQHVKAIEILSDMSYVYFKLQNYQLSIKYQIQNTYLLELYHGKNSVMFALNQLYLAQNYNLIRDYKKCGELSLECSYTFKEIYENQQKSDQHSNQSLDDNESDIQYQEYVEIVQSPTSQVSSRSFNFQDRQNSKNLDTDEDYSYTKTRQQQLNNTKISKYLTGQLNRNQLVLSNDDLEKQIICCQFLHCLAISKLKLQEQNLQSYMNLYNHMIKYKSMNLEYFYYIFMQSLKIKISNEPVYMKTFLIKLMMVLKDKKFQYIQEKQYNNDIRSFEDLNISQNQKNKQLLLHSELINDPYTQFSRGNFSVDGQNIKILKKCTSKSKGIVNLLYNMLFQFQNKIDQVKDIKKFFKHYDKQDFDQVFQEQVDLYKLIIDIYGEYFFWEITQNNSNDYVSYNKYIND